MCECVCARVCVFGIHNRCVCYKTRKKIEEETYTHKHRIVRTVAVLTCKMDDQTYLHTDSQSLKKAIWFNLIHNFHVHIKTLVIKMYENHWFYIKLHAKHCKEKKRIYFPRNERINRDWRNHFNEERKLLELSTLNAEVCWIYGIKWYTLYNLFISRIYSWTRVHCIQIFCLTVFTMEALFEFGTAPR